MKQFIKSILFILCLLMMSSCSYVSKISSMTNEDITSKLSRPISYVQIYSIFGSPTFIYINKDGCKEVIYRYQSTKNKYSSKYKKNKCLDELIIFFNKKEISESYKISVVNQDNQNYK